MWMVYVLYIFNLYIYQKFDFENDDFGISYYFKYMFYVSTLSLFAIKSALKLINAAQAITMSGNNTFYVHINTCNSSSCCYILRGNWSFFFNKCVNVKSNGGNWGHRWLAHDLPIPHLQIVNSLRINIYRQ